MDLPDVTLCAADTANISGATRALEICRKHFSFGDTVFLTDALQAFPWRVDRIASLNFKGAYSSYVGRHLAQHIHTKFVLLVQYDGYIINPECWRDDFLAYDYIGALWPWHRDGKNVGNGGFCLRSKKLLDILATLPGPDGVPEDDYICRELRPKLEIEHGIRFAPPSLAELFSYERAAPAQPTFGFHGLFNMWRHVGDEEIEAVVAGADYIPLTVEYAELLMTYYSLRKFKPMKVLYARLKNLTDPLPHMSRLFRDTAAVVACVQACEAVVGVI